MQIIILAAGYGTRMYPLTENKPKALLKVGKQTILDTLIFDCKEKITLVTNNRFYKKFKKYKNQNIKIVNNLTNNPEERLGAIKDLYLASKDINDDILIAASDNLLTFSLQDIVNSFNDKNQIMYYKEFNLDNCKRTGIIEIDSNSRVLSFQEKPNEPKSNLAVPPFYLLKKESLKHIEEYINLNKNLDSLGYFMEWLITKTDVYAIPMIGKRIDIGNLETYEKIK